MTQETPPTPEGSGPPAPRPAPRYGGPPRRDDRGGRDGGGRGFGPGGLRRPRRKVCAFCVDKVQRIDFKAAPVHRRARPRAHVPAGARDGRRATATEA